ncbi:phage holin family protein [Gemella haemolysans]|uniref:Phage holin family protein n=1 Tax=Gemella haemolysans TaxID=1379 RepID=A0AAW6B2Z3_9BACL|nr:phage holin family protein [Gemella haemolysans]MDB6185571.1 phage holin family protein [Gemella haemolysans]MDU4714220.1 phage holin family protein [Gemella haemolysans]
MQIFKILYWPIIKKVILNTFIVIAFSGLTKGSLRVDHPVYGFLGALLITILFVLIRPLLLISIMITIFSFGLFSLLVRTLLVYLVSYILSPHFEIMSFWTAFGLVIIIMLFNFILNTNDRKIIIRTFKNK